MAKEKYTSDKDIEDTGGAIPSHHWKGLAPRPDTNFGFVYIIRCISTDKRYIGKKQYRSYFKVKQAGKTRRKTLEKETDWATYTGSSKDLNADIARLGKDAFEFKILCNCPTKGWLVYTEAYLQHRYLCMVDQEGWYNKHIAEIKFTLKKPIPTEIKKVLK